MIVSSMKPSRGPLGRSTVRSTGQFFSKKKWWQVVQGFEENTGGPSKSFG